MSEADLQLGDGLEYIQMNVWIGYPGIGPGAGGTRHLTLVTSCHETRSSSEGGQHLETRSSLPCILNICLTLYHHPTTFEHPCPTKSTSR